MSAWMEKGMDKWEGKQKEGSKDGRKMGGWQGDIGSWKDANGLHLIVAWEKRF